MVSGTKVLLTIFIAFAIRLTDYNLAKYWYKKAIQLKSCMAFYQLFF